MNSLLLLLLLGFAWATFYKAMPHGIEQEVKSFCPGTRVSHASITRHDVTEEIGRDANSRIAAFRMTLHQPHKELAIAIHDPAHDAYISASLASTGQWETNIYHFMARATQQTGAFIDVGANIGSFSLAAAHAGRQVLSIEPSRHNVRKIAQTMALNPELTGNWTVYWNAASDVNGQRVALRKGDTRNYSNFKTGTTATAAGQGLYGVDHSLSVRLDDVIPTAWDHVALLKIDIEGNEPYALAGAARTLCTRMVRLIVMEVNIAATGCPDGIRRMTNWLRRIGYTMYHDNNPSMSGRPVLNRGRGANVFLRQNWHTPPVPRHMSLEQCLSLQ